MQAIHVLRLRDSPIYIYIYIYRYILKLFMYFNVFYFIGLFSVDLVLQRLSLDARSSYCVPFVEFIDQCKNDLHN